MNAGDSSWTIGSSKSIPTKETSVWREICNTEFTIFKNGRYKLHLDDSSLMTDGLQ
jgi:hypothetical protein